MLKHYLQTDLEDGGSVAVNNPGIYRNMCCELDIDALAVNTLFQSHANIVFSNKQELPVLEEDEI